MTLSLLATVATLAATAVVVTGCGSGGTPTASTWSAPVDGQGAGGSSAAQAAGPQSAEASAPASAAASPTGPVTYTFPVVAKNLSYAREHHDYPASDIISPCGSAVRAATSGVILEVSRVDKFDKAHPKGEDKGGISVSLLGDDGVRYYGSHLSAIQPGIDAGVRVASGAQIGVVGKTGNANNTCHLHFGISPLCQRTGDWWQRRGLVWPWKYLDAWKAGQNKSPVDEVNSWLKAHSCTATVPPGTV